MHRHLRNYKARVALVHPAHQLDAPELAKHVSKGARVSIEERASRNR